MKTDILGSRPQGVTSNRRASLICALVSLPLCLAGGCVAGAADDPEQTAAQAVTGGCEVQLPLAWTGFGVTCIEDSSPMTISLEYNQTYFATAFGFGARGEAQFRCTPGPLAVDFSWCVASEGSPE